MGKSRNKKGNRQQNQQGNTSSKKKNENAENKQSSTTGESEMDDRYTVWRQFIRQNSTLVLGIAFVVIPCVAAFTGAYLQKLYTEENFPFDLGRGKPISKLLPKDHYHQPNIASHQKAPLSKPYNVDYREVMRQRKEAMSHYDYPYDEDGVDKRSELSLEEYYDVYDGKWPVVVTDVVENWPASNWSTEFFIKNHGMDRVAMTAVDKNRGERVTLALQLELFLKNIEHGYPDSWTYIGDELFIPMRPKLRQDIGECEYMNEDFYSLFPPEVRPWNAMLLWGTAHSRSTLHIDPYNWTGTNAVFKGRKRWKLYQPVQDEFLDIFPGMTSGFPLDSTKYNSPIDAFEPDFLLYPQFAKTKPLMFDQLPGEILFIPTGWFHEAYNVEETLAVSSQMMNRNNFRIILEEILKVNDIKRSDLPPNIDSLEPEDQVQAVMALIPEEVLQRGRAVSDDAIDQVNNNKGKRYDPNNIERRYDPNHHNERNQLY